MPSSRKPNNSELSALIRAIAANSDSRGAPAQKMNRQTEPTTKGAFFGLLFLVLVNALVLGLITRVLHSAEVVSWTLTPWQCLSLSALWVVWRAVDRVTAKQ